MDLLQFQTVAINTATMTAAATILGVIVAFVLLYMILERKKKTLMVVFVVALAAFGWFYWKMSRVAAIEPPKAVVTEPIHIAPSPPPVPLPKPRPRVIKKAAKAVKPKPPLQICPCSKGPQDH